MRISDLFLFYDSKIGVFLSGAVSYFIVYNDDAFMFMGLLLFFCCSLYFIAKESILPSPILLYKISGFCNFSVYFLLCTYSWNADFGSWYVEHMFSELSPRKGKNKKKEEN